MLPPVFGLYSTVLSAFAHFIFGINPFQSIGPFALVSLLSGDVSLSQAIALNGTISENNSRMSEPWEMYPFLIPISDLLTLTVSIILFLMLLTGMGKRIKAILPNILIKGFTGAAALSIVTSQVKLVLGITIPPITGTFIMIRTWIALIQEIHQFQIVTFILSISTIIFMASLEFLENNWSLIVNRMFAFLPHRQYVSIESPAAQAHNNLIGGTTTINASDKKGANIPKMLISVIAITCIAYFGKLEEMYSIALVGRIHAGLPEFNSPIRIFNQIDNHKLVSALVFNIIFNGLAISLIIYVTLLSVIQSFPSSPNDHSSERALSIPLGTHEIEPERAPIPSENLSESPIQYRNEVDASETTHIMIENSNQIHVLVQSQQERRKGFLNEWQEEDNELLAISVASLLCSCYSGFAASSSLSRSSILASQTNSKSPLANVVGSIFVIITVMFLTNLIYHVPLTCLAAIIISSLQKTIQNITEVKILWNAAMEKRGLKQWHDFSLFLITFVAVVLFDPCTGIVIGMTASIVWILFKIYHKLSF